MYLTPKFLNKNYTFIFLFPVHWAGKYVFLPSYVCCINIFPSKEYPVVDIFLEYEIWKEFTSYTKKGVEIRVADPVQFLPDSVLKNGSGSIKKMDPDSA